MEASCCYCPTQSHSKPKFSSVPSHPIHPQQLPFSRPDGVRRRRRRLSNQGSLTAARGCAKGGEVERELEEEMGEDAIGGRWREKCEGKGGGGGIAELMECLEREAIMGEDEGKEPNDYNRRALIFDKSSRVFRALKEKLDAQKS